ncbi:hypothetical protein K6I34_001575, partial [Streptomyces sp. UNOC14_S4]|nr:hypothetical protein [Streptomyces sp. UNOC14_S4]
MGATSPHRPADESAAAIPPSLRRTVTAALCLVLGIGLICGAAAGTWLARPAGRTATERSFERGRALWHSVPVDALFPRTLRRDDAGPGGAPREWTRVGV